jgi:serine beta-lactamase-like protein LACTB
VHRDIHRVIILCNTKYIVVGIVALLAAGCGGHQRSAGRCKTTSAATAYRSAIDADRPLLRPLYRGLRAPGLALAVAVRGRIVWSATCGFADLGRRVPVQDTTQFRIGSVSKTLTAAALVHYADTGAVDLDAPITRYLPGFPHARGITLRRLAGHLAGIRHYETADEAVNGRHFRSVRATVALFANDPLVARPGSRFAYSSYGYDVIGAALERATHLPFAALMQRSVLRPAGLAGTTLVRGPRQAQFYELTNRGSVRRAPPIDLSDRLPGGGFVSTARDLARFGSLLAAGGVVRRSSVRLMFTSQRTTSGVTTGYGLGFEVHPSPAGVLVGHTGAVDGGTAGLVVHPASATALALATNVGYATAEAPPPPRPGTPDPPRLLLPFLRR